MNVISKTIALLVFITSCLNEHTIGQPIPFNKKYADSILVFSSRLPEDSIKLNHFATLSMMFFSQNGDTTIAFAVEGAALAKKIGYTTGLISCLQQQAFYFDIIKAHGGEILVKSSPVEGTVFTINLPDGNKI